MTDLDEAMREHMAYIVFFEHKPFCYKDFLSFEVNGKLHHISHGTFRNKISKMMQNDEVEVDIRSNPNFYTLNGCRFTNGKLMTGNHMEATNKTISVQKIIRHPIYHILEGTSFGQRAIHNLHFKFSIKNMYNHLLNKQGLKDIDKDNKGIVFHYNDINKVEI